MSTTTVHLRWDGERLSRKALLTKAGMAVKKVQAIFGARYQLDLQAKVDEAQQFVQLTIAGDCSTRDTDRMQDILKKEFRGKKSWWHFW